MSLPRLIGQVIAFSRFWLAREAGLLISDGAVIELAARPFAVLSALLDANGRVVSTAELRELVWNGTQVDANTVQAQISAIRRALGEERDLIVTVPGRGYRVAGEIRTVDSPDASLHPAHGGDLARAQAGDAQRRSIAASLATSSAASANSGRLSALGPARGSVSSLSFAPASGATGGAFVHAASAASGSSLASSLGSSFPAADTTASHDASRATFGDRAFSALAREADFNAQDDAVIATPARSVLAPMSAESALRSQTANPSPFIGRHAELSELLALVPTRRIVTLTGAAGIGKTRLAAEAASRLASHFPDGTYCAELASLGQPERVANAIGAAVGLDPNPRLGEPATLAARIGERRMLVIVDHCDHLPEAAGQTIDDLIANTAALHVIVTSEAPLFIAGELAVPVAPLRVPPDSVDGASGAASNAAANTASITSSATVAYDALHLLFRRLAQALKAAGHDVRALDTPAPSTFNAAARVCRRVEGVPLALELAAASVASRVAAGDDIDNAIATFADALDARVMRRSGARRLGLPRSAIVQTIVELAATSLDEAARNALRRLGIFTGAFSRDAAHEVLGAFDPHRATASEPYPFEPQLRTLIEAGLVNAVDCGGAPRLRLPHAVRRFALDALDRHRESNEAAAHHTYYVAREIERLANADAARIAGPPPARRPTTAHGIHDAYETSSPPPLAETHTGAHARHDIDALRAALEWAVSADKVELCADLLDHSASLWVALSLVDEYIDWIRAALARADAVPIRRIRDEMRLRAVLARALMLRRSASAEIVESWERTYQLATVCADTPHRLRALFCLVMSALDAGEVERCIQLSNAFSEIAATAQSPAAEVNARRLQGIVKAYHGELDEAIQLLTPLVEPAEPAAFASDTPDPHASDRALAQRIDEETIREANAMATSFGLSLHLVASAILATALWFTGQPHSAAPLKSALHDPAADECEPLACSIALALACALAVLDDDVALAESCAASLVTCARLSGLRRWLRAGLDVQLWLDARHGDDDAARRLLGGAAKRIARDQIYLLDVAFIATLLPRTALDDDPDLLASLGAAMQTAVRRGKRVGEHWHGPELQRIEASLRLAAGDDPNTVRALLGEALERARQCRAQRIELRITVDLEALDASLASGTLRIR